MFGGLGYMEDSGIPSILRDTQTLSIWEGTTNVLSLDMLRAAEKENGMTDFAAWSKEILAELSSTTHSTLHSKVVVKLHTFLEFVSALDKEASIASSNEVAFYLAELTIAILWLDFLTKNDNADYQNVLQYWLTYKMNDASLKEAEVLGLTSTVMSSQMK